MAEPKDYNRILTDTVSGILFRAKEFASSDAVTDTVARVRDTASGTGVLEIYEKGARRAKSFGSATKTTLELTRDRKELERVFCEIGKLYYERNRFSADEAFAPLFRQVEALTEGIRAKEAEVEAYKASFEKGGKPAKTASELDSSIMDFEAIVNRTENDGTST